MGSTNHWCEALGITQPGLAPGPRFEHLTPYELLVAALLDRGGPMTLDDVVAAVRVARPLDLPQGLRMRLMKSWGGRDPVRKDAEERYVLELSSWRWPSILDRLGLTPSRGAPPPPPRDPAPTPAPIDQPLSLEEIELAFGQYGVRAPMSGVRIAAAVLEAVGHPMTVEEILAALPAAARPPAPGAYRPAPSRPSRPPLVVAEPDGRLRLVVESNDRLVVRILVRSLASAMRSRRDLEAVIERRRVASRVSEIRKRADAKVDWKGYVFAVEPRIRLMRSYDQRSHSYLGYVLRLHGTCGGVEGTFSVAIGPAAHATHAFRAGDEVEGKGTRVTDHDAEPADVYRAHGFKVGVRGAASPEQGPPFQGIPPPLETYRARGHRRLSAARWESLCTGCLWGAEMAVDMVIDPWKPSNVRHRRETFCYGPKSCPRYLAGPARKVPGRKGSSWTEADWVDEDATSHRGPDA